MSRVINVTATIGKTDVVDKSDGEKIFNAIKKALKETKCKVFVDFAGVGVFTSNAGNYAIGQLCEDLKEFDERIVVLNVNRYTASILGRVIENAKKHYEVR